MRSVSGASSVFKRYEFLFSSGLTQLAYFSRVTADLGYFIFLFGDFVG